MIDFICILFNNSIEIELFKIQAYSFLLVDQNIINNIYVLFNDHITYKENFKKEFNNDIINFYPKYLKPKIRVIFLDDINLYFKNSNWFTQQICKIQISKFINSYYYVVLDGKNHFIKNITKEYFFTEDNKPHLYFEPNGDGMLNFYNNCLTYFNVNCPNMHRYSSRIKIQTTTPFLFIRDECINLINFIETKENKSFSNFFLSKKYTEFFLYFAYLIYSNKQNLYNYNHNMFPKYIVGPLKSNKNSKSTWDCNLDFLNKYPVYFISIHRNAISTLDDRYKNTIFNFYKNIYNDNKIINNIKNLLNI